MHEFQTPSRIWCYAPCWILSKFWLFRGNKKILTVFYNKVVYQSIYFGSINNQCTWLKLYLHNYILYLREPTYVGTFPVYLGMSLIFTDFKRCTWLRLTPYWRICEDQSHSLGVLENSNVAQLSGTALFFNQMYCLLFYFQIYFYRPHGSCGKVMFLHLSVILFTGGVCLCVQGMVYTPQTDTPLGRHAPGQTPPWADTPPPLRRPLQQMVRILLECIFFLVS